MSSILEALKKLEDEKAVRKSGAGNIVGKVAKSGRRPKQQPKWILPVAMAAVASVAVLVTYLFMGGRTAPVGTKEERPVVPQNQAPSHLQQPPLPAAAPKPIPSSPQPSGRRVTSAPTPAPVKLKQAPIAETSKPPAKVIAAPAPIPATTPKPDTKPALPTLIISGIGWQKGNADRLAIVNGKPVMEGEMIDGARVVEIFPDRVRFSIDDRTIDVPMGKYSGESR